MRIMSPLMTRTAGLFTLLVVLSSASSVQVPPTLAEAPSIRSVTSNSLGITWSEWDGESDGGDGPVIGYKVYHRMQGEEDFTVSFPDLIPDTSATISDLTRDTEYEIAVAPVRPGLGGEGSMSPHLHTRTYCEAPSEVPVLAFRVIGLTSITLSWQLPAEETWGCRPGSTSEIRIVYGTEGNTKTTVSFPTSAEMGTLSSLLECTIYEITGFISNKDQIVGSLPAATSVRTAPIIPEAVSNFQYSPSSTQIFFTWSVSITSCPPDYYIIRYSLLQKRACPTPEPNVIQHETIINTTNNEFNLMGLEAYSTYSIDFVAANDAGEGEAVERTVFTQHGTPPSVTGLRVNTSITDPTSIGFIWDALTCSNTGGVFGYYYARLYEHGQAQGSTPLTKYIDYIDKPSVLFDDLQPCTMYELILTASINTASPGATYPVYASGDFSRASGLTGLTLSNVRVEASSTRASSMVVRWSVPAPCSVSYYSLEYQLIEYLACPGDPIPDAPVSTLNVTGSYNIVSGLEPFSSYRVSITGIINGARNTPVIPVVVTGPTSESAPSAMSSVSYTAEADTLHFTWDALPCEDLHGELYGYEYNLYNTLTRSYVGSSRETTRATRLTIDRLNACSDYRFQVRVVLQSGHRGDWTTLVTRRNISVPEAVSNFQYSPSSTQISITWSVSTTSCTPDYYIIRYTLLQKRACPSPEPNIIQHETIINTTNNEFVLIGLEAYSTYSIAFVAVNDAGEGEALERIILTRHRTPPAVTGLRVDTSITDPTSIGFMWDALTCSNTGGLFGYYYARIYEHGQDHGFTPLRKYIDYTDQSSVSFDDLQPCTMYEFLLTTAINTASPGATHPVYVSGDHSRASGLTGLTFSNVRVEASSTEDSSMLVRWSVPAPCSVSYYSLEYQLIEHLACPGDPIPEAPVSTLNVTGSYNILSGLEPFSSYRVSITGIINGSGNTPVVVTGPSSESAPSALSSVSYTAEANTLHFTWDALPCEDLHGELYVYEYNLYNTLTRSYVGSSRGTTRATRLTIDGLNACSDYRFQLRVVLQSGHKGDWTTLMARRNISVPEAVSNFQYSPSATQIFFTWSVSTTSCTPDYYIIRYTLQQKRACPSPEPNVIQHEIITNTTNNEFNLMGLEAYSTYSIAFVAVNDAGEGEAVERTIFTQHGTSPAVTGLRVDTSITDPTSIGFIWDALTCSNIGGVFGYYYARIYEHGQTQGLIPLKKYIDYIDQSSVLFADLQPCTMYELLLTTTINTASPGATHPVYVSGDHSRASGLTGLTLSNVRVEASSARDSSMVVRWSVPAPCSVSYFSLEYQLIDYLACPGHPIPEAPVSTLNVTGSYNILSGLEPFSSYRVSITGIINGARNTPVVVTGPSSESAPSPLSSVSYSAEADTLHFTWDALPCEDLHGELYGYEYNLYDNITRSYVGSSSETTPATHLIIDGLNACSDYRFQVRVVLQSGHRSDWTRLMARTNISAPGQPHITDLEPHRNELGTTGLTVSWAAPNDNSKPCQPTAYEIHYRLLQVDMCNDTAQAPKERAGVVPGSTLTFDLPNLRPYSEYSVYVRGSTSAGYGPEDVMQQTTSYATLTGLPTNLQASIVKKRSLTFTWEEPLCGERHGPITGYDLILYDATSGEQVGRSNVSSASALEASFPDLIPFYNYSVSIRARNYELLGPYGPRVTQQTREAKQPAPPIAVTVPSSDLKSLIVEWQSPNPPEAHIIGYYIVYWETMLHDADSGDRMNVSIPCTRELCLDINERLPHTIIGLNSETNYSIQVRAESQKGISPPSSPTVTKITREGLPSAPGSLNITGNSETSLMFSWRKPRYPRGRIVEYKIWYRITNKPYDDSFLPEGTFSEWRTGGNVTSLVLDDLLPATLYEASLVASTKVGPGDPSEPVEGYTSPPSVEDLPVPFPPDIGLSPDNLPVISFSEDLDSPYITHVLVSVSIRASISRRRRRREISCGCSSTIDQDSYIAGKVSRRSLPMEFTVGDNTTIGGCYNAPLQDGATYGISIGFECNTRDESTCVIGGPTEIQYDKDPSPRGLGGNTLPTVGGVSFAVVLLIIVVIALLYTRRRRNRHHHFKKELVRNQRTPRIKGLDDYNQHGSHIQMGHVSAEDYVNAPTADGSYYEEVNTGGNDIIYESVQDEVPAGMAGEHRPIPISQLVQHVAQKKASTTAGFKQDYDIISIPQLYPWNVANKPENKQKNRDINMLAYDHSRVVLTPLGNDPHSDYINASYIDGYNRPKKYIATQGPNTASVNDFWRMLWEHDCDMIVMLTNLVEGEKKKCEKYWPEKKTLYGKIAVTMTKEEINVHYTVRTFIVKLLKDTREVVQFHYTSWPDMGVPQYTTPLMNLIRTTKQHKADSQGHTIVHCSAGVGRTETFIILDSMLDQAEAEGVIDVFNFVSAMRKNIVKMFQGYDQYLFIFNALLETFTSGDTSIAQDVYLQRYPSLLTPRPETGSTILQEQFGCLETFTAIPRDSELTGARSQRNMDKNRYLGKLPTEESRPHLITEFENGTDYINASFLPGYTKKDMFIGTQSPLPNTVVDFWRLVFDYKICTIIMLNGQPLENQSMAQYWPDGSQNEVCFGPFTISLINEKHYDELSTRTLEVRSTTLKSRVQTVCQLQLHTWPMACDISSSAISIIELHRRAMIWNDKIGKDAPILVHCKDGEGATGTFCALSSVMERVHVEKLVDVFQACKKLRAIRGGTVASVAQYEFIHSVMKLYLESNGIYENYSA